MFYYSGWFYLLNQLIKTHTDSFHYERCVTNEIKVILFSLVIPSELLVKPSS